MRYLTQLSLASSKNLHDKLDLSASITSPANELMQPPAPNAQAGATWLGVVIPPIAEIKFWDALGVPMKEMMAPVDNKPNDAVIALPFFSFSSFLFIPVLVFSCFLFILHVDTLLLIPFLFGK